MHGQPHVRKEDHYALERQIRYWSTMRSQSENSDFFLRIRRQRPHWLLGKTQSRRSWLFFITARFHLTERHADGIHNLLCKCEQLCLSYDVLIQLTDFREIWYEYHSIADDTNFAMNVTASQMTRILLRMSQHHRWHEFCYECHSITDDTNFAMNVTAPQMTPTLV
jgi:hypothetical protein